jgi:hypothetical protein
MRYDSMPFYLEDVDSGLGKEMNLSPSALKVSLIVIRLVGTKFSAHRNCSCKLV